MTASLARVPLTLAAALAFHVSMSPPSAPDTDKSGDKQAVCATARVITTLLSKGLFWASVLTDTLIVLAPHARAHSPITIPSMGALLSWIRHPTQRPPGLGLSPALSLSLPTSLLLSPLPLATIAGTALALTGAYLRFAAYRALGRFYACPNRGAGPCIPHGAGGHAHALITTGPYRFVRHPGYAGLTLCTTGLVVLQLDALRAGDVGSWSGGVGLSGGLSAGMRVVALACAVLAIIGAQRRIQDEEWSLRTRFKGEWEAWAERVPYRLAPGVY